MSELQKLSYAQTVQRRVPGSVRLVQIMLYLAVAVFAVVGASGGIVWGLLAVGTLLLAWYLMGTARVTYLYQLTGTRLRVQRVSGFKSRPKTEDFGNFVLTRLRVMAPEDSPFLDEAEADTRDLNPKRVTYNVSSRDTGSVCSVMFLEGVDQESGLWLKVYFEPSPELRNHIARIRPGRVRGYDDDRA